MVPIRCGEFRNGIGSVLSGRTLSCRYVPELPMRPALVAARLGKFKALAPNETAALPLRGGGGNRIADVNGSAVAQAVGGAFPLRDVVGDHAGRFHRGLAELGVAGNLALDALAFGMQQVAQAFQFGDQVFDFRQRGSGDALDQRVDVVDGGLGARLERRLGASACSARAAQIGDVVADEIADAGLDFRDRGKIAVLFS